MNRHRIAFAQLDFRPSIRMVLGAGVLGTIVYTITCVGCAWACPTPMGFLPTTALHGDADPPLRSPDLMTRQSSFGCRREMAVYVSAATTVTWDHLEDSPTITVFNTGNPEDVLFDRVVRIESGWPIPGLRGVRTEEDIVVGANLLGVLNDPRPLGTSGSVSIASIGASRHQIPLIPTWPGFALGTLVHSIALLLLVTIARVAIQLMRLHRRRCPRCAYALIDCPSGGCPECGWSRREELRGSISP